MTITIIMIDVTKQVRRLLENNPNVVNLVGENYFARGAQGDAKDPYILYHSITFRTTPYGDRTEYYQVSAYAMDSVLANQVKDAIVETFNRLHNVVTGDGTVIKSCTLPDNMRPSTGYDEETKMIGHHITIKLVFNDQSY